MDGSQATINPTDSQMPMKIKDNGKVSLKIFRRNLSSTKKCKGLEKDTEGKEERVSRERKQQKHSDS